MEVRSLVALVAADLGAGAEVGEVVEVAAAAAEVEGGAGAAVPVVAKRRPTLAARTRVSRQDAEVRCKEPSSSN